MGNETSETPLRILLVMPTPFENGRLGLENVIWLSEPVGLTAIAAAVRSEHEIRILDLRHRGRGPSSNAVPRRVRAAVRGRDRAG
jgi:hypothetical protein